MPVEIYAVLLFVWMLISCVWGVCYKSHLETDDPLNKSFFKRWVKVFFIPLIILVNGALWILRKLF